MPDNTRIVAWIAANATEELKQLDASNYWRTLKVNGLINEKYPGGVEAQTVLLKH